MNVIHAFFNPEFKKQVYIEIKYRGVKRAEINLIAQGFHPSFVRALIRNITRTMGW
ncbi:MAG: hypothetical protein ACXVB1_00210 [Pseudobdellovibrionaceae bacterium]